MSTSSFLCWLFFCQYGSAPMRCRHFSARPVSMHRWHALTNCSVFMTGRPSGYRISIIFWKKPHGSFIDEMPINATLVLTSVGNTTW